MSPIGAKRLVVVAPASSQLDFDSRARLSAPGAIMLKGRRGDLF